MRLIAPKGIAFTDVKVELPDKPIARPRGWFTRLIWPLLRIDKVEYVIKTVPETMTMQWTEYSVVEDDLSREFVATSAQHSDA